MAFPISQWSAEERGAQVAEGRVRLRAKARVKVPESALRWRVPVEEE
jgi:hypothetical protein